MGDVPVSDVFTFKSMGFYSKIRGRGNKMGFNCCNGESSQGYQRHTFGKAGVDRWFNILLDI
jgi:hypothetical protein